MSGSFGANVGNNGGALIHDPLTGNPIPKTFVPFGTYGQIGEEIPASELGEDNPKTLILIEFTPEGGDTVMVRKDDLFLEADYTVNENVDAA